MTGTRRHNFMAETRGFTLIELMVAVGIFGLLMLMVLSITTRTTLIQRRDRGEQAVQEELRLAIELFNREVRTGYGSTFASNGSSLTFRNQNRNCVSFILLNKSLQRSEVTVDDPSISCDDLQVDYTGSYQSLTSQNVVVNRLAWRTTSAQVNNTDLATQGYVVMSIAATANTKTDKTVSFESAVTSRQIIPFN